ncbi:MAG: hypothetical protein QG597_685 [Actinomycetota bacterium]|nr:hypothetical protein [Actinomycetota bacterium]
MKRFGVPNEARPFVADLRAIGRTGIHTYPALTDSCLLELPVVTGFASPQAPVAERARIFIDALERAIETRLRGKDQLTARMFFGYGEHAGVSSRDRYYAIAKLHGKPGWNGFRQEPLDRHLVAVFLALHALGEESSGFATAVPAPAAASRSRPLVAGGDYVLVSREVTYNFPQQDGAVREILDARVVEATADNVTRWRQTKYYRGTSKLAQPEFTLFGPGDLSILRESPERRDVPARGHLLQVQFHRPLQRGEQAEFTIVMRQAVHYSDLVKADHHDGWRIEPIIPTAAFRVGVRFPPDCRPRVVWHYEDLPSVLAPGVPTEANTLNLDETGYAGYEWSDLLVGYAYGLEWEW